MFTGTRVMFYNDDLQCVFVCLLSDLSRIMTASIWVYVSVHFNARPLTCKLVRPQREALFSLFLHLAYDSSHLLILVKQRSNISQFQIIHPHALKAEGKVVIVGGGLDFLLLTNTDTIKRRFSWMQTTGADAFSTLAVSPTPL